MRPLPPLRSPVLEGQDIFYNIISITAQTLCYGVYCILFSASWYILSMKTPHTSANRLIIATVAMFTLSTISWAAAVTFPLVRIRAYWVVPSPSVVFYNDIFSSLAGALGPVNYALADAVVIWRAWVLCKDDSRKALYVTFGFLACTVVCVTGTIGIRCALIAVEAQIHVKPAHLTSAINATQLGGIFFNIITNISSTSIIVVKAWRHRQVIKQGLRDSANKRTQVERVLVLLIESGLLYVLSGTTALLSSVIRLPYGTLGDIYSGVNVQVAGIYPTIVILLVSLRKSLDDTTFFTLSNIPRTVAESSSSRRSHDVRQRNRLVFEPAVRVGQHPHERPS